LKPRDEDPQKYCDNVRKSWLVMQEVVRQINNECYIAHLEPNPGVGYDCLSLVVPDNHGYRSEKHGYMTTKFMLNRNGQNGLCGGTVIHDIWEYCDTDAGVKKLANDLIEYSGLSRLVIGESKSVISAVCAFITKWIGEQSRDDFCVAPPGWPGGCRIFEPACNFPDDYDYSLWPTHLGEPYISLGSRHIEVARIRMTDASIRLNKTETGQIIYSDQDSSRKEFGTDYLAALSFWGKFKTEKAAEEKAIEIIKLTEKELGKVVLAHVNGARNYVAVRFEKSNGVGSVFINKGFVDHEVDIPGSTPHQKHLRLRRTLLPTSINSAATHKKSPEVKETLCSKCYGLYPAHLSACPICTGA
jgi:hypothetical protein